MFQDRKQFLIEALFRRDTKHVLVVKHNVKTSFFNPFSNVPSKVVMGKKKRQVKVNTGF